MERKINEFLDKKNIKQPFVRDCVAEFIKGHTKIYGKIVPFEELMSRLDENLDKITFTNGRIGDLGQYIGRTKEGDQNEILLQASESDLEIPEGDKAFFDIYTEKDKQTVLQECEKRKEDIRSTIFHELTHAAYTIKGEYGIGEEQMFAQFGQNAFGGNFVGGSLNYMEAMTNYISNRVQGKTPGEITTYKYETESIYMLAEKIGEEGIIGSAWTGDFRRFQESFGEINYQDFNDAIGKLKMIYEREKTQGEYYKQSQDVMKDIKDILDGKYKRKTFNAVSNKNLLELEKLPSEDPEKSREPSKVHNKTPEESRWMNRFKSWYGSIDKLPQKIKDKILIMRAKIIGAIKKEIRSKEEVKEETEEERDSK